MKKNILKSIIVLSIVLCTMLCFAITASAEIASGECGDNLSWTLDDNGTLTVSGKGEIPDYTYSALDENPWYGYREEVNSIVIQKGVTVIGTNAFHGCENATSISIPNTVTAIRDFVFDGDKLTRLSIPDSVTSIGFYSFYGCSGLTDIFIPESVSYIGQGAFSFCSRLTKITVDKNNPEYTSVDGILFSKGVTELIIYPAGKTQSTYSVPDTVTSIVDHSFHGCKYLTRLSIPEDVSSIGAGAFFYTINMNEYSVDKGNSSYTSIDGVLFNKDKTTLLMYPAGNTRTSYTVPDTVTTLENYSFHSCKLTDITLPDSLTSVVRQAFASCKSIANVYYTGTQSQWNKINIGDKNEPLTDAKLHVSTRGKTDGPPEIDPPDNSCGPELTWSLDDEGTLTVSGNGKMDNWSSSNHAPWYLPRRDIKAVVIDEGVTSIGEYAFYKCDNLTTVTIPDSISSVGEYAFSSCKNLTDISYSGTENQWDEISIGSENESLTEATHNRDSDEDSNEDTETDTDSEKKEKRESSDSGDSKSGSTLLLFPVLIIAALIGIFVALLVMFLVQMNAKSKNKNITQNAQIPQNEQAQQNGQSYQNQQGGQSYQNQQGGQSYQNQQNGQSYQNQQGGQNYQNQQGGQNYQNQQGGQNYRQ